MLSGLLAPLRLPEKALEALDSVVEALQELEPMRAELVRVREQTEPVAGLLAALDPLEGELAPRLDALHAELVRVREQTDPLGDLLPALDRLEAALAPRLDALHAELVRVREQTEPMGLLLPALDHLEQTLASRLDAMHELVKALEGEESHLGKRMDHIATELGSMHKTLAALQDDLQRVTDRLPDPDEKRGPLEAARDVLTGSGKGD